VQGNPFPAINSVLRNATVEEMNKHFGFVNQPLLIVLPTQEISGNARTSVHIEEILPSQIQSRILESTSCPAELHWKRRIALAVLTDATKVNNEVYLIEIPAVIDNTVFTIVDEGFESGTGELDHHMSDNNNSENQPVVDDSVDIPDVINVEVDLPTIDTCGELSKCLNVIELQPKVFTVECDFCTFKSSRVEEFRKHLLVHDDIYDLHWNSSIGRRERTRPKVIYS